MLHRCCYPRCVGQASSWVISPLGYNTLLGYLDHNNSQANKYAKTTHRLKDNKFCTVRNKLFLSMANKLDKNKLSDASLETDELDFKNNKEATNIISQWVRDPLSWTGFTSYAPHFFSLIEVDPWGVDRVLQLNQANREADFKEFDIAKYVPLNTTLCLVNLCLFKGVWQRANPPGRRMKVHNTFAYTQDINYEPRILEMPLDEDFRLIVLVPNEVDLLHTLFRRLTNEGLTASFASVQPLFTAPSILRPPNIKISSDTSISFEEDNKNLNRKVIQHGNVIVDDIGVSIKVLTCLYMSNEPIRCNAAETITAEKSPIFFAIIFEDSPIFTGQYVEEKC